MTTRSRFSSLGACLALAASLAAAPAARAAGLPPIRHVFTIVLENSEFAENFGLGQAVSPYLSRELPMKGALIPNYFGTGHSSLDNYIAMVSGQGPNQKTQDDCDEPTTLGGTTGVTFNGDGQAIGAAGCTYPASVKEVGTQLTDAGFTWKGYMQDMDAQPGRKRTTCRGPYTRDVIESPVPAGHPKTPDDYKAKHNPFVYFHTVFDDLAYCDARDVPFDAFAADIASESTTPNFSFIVPNQCDDGHDNPTCTDGSQGGLPPVDAFLRKYVPMILDSPAFRRDGLLLITWDEGISGLGCCGEKKGPNLPSNRSNGQPWPDPLGQGGGQTGAIAISPFVAPGTVTPTPYNHYSYLRSMEDLFGLAHLGYAAADGLVPFGGDVYTNY
jgi:hypothetical protein